MNGRHPANSRLIEPIASGHMGPLQFAAFRPKWDEPDKVDRPPVPLARHARIGVSTLSTFAMVDCGTSSRCVGFLATNGAT